LTHRISVAHQILCRYESHRNKLKLSSLMKLRVLLAEISKS